MNWEVDSDWLPFGFSSSSELQDLPLVFAGYGITAPEAGYDDYADLDVTGAAVLVLRHEPQINDPHSVFNGTKHRQPRNVSVQGSKRQEPMVRRP